MFDRNQSRIIIILGLLGVFSCIFSFSRLSEIPALDFKFPLEKEKIIIKADSFIDLQGYSYRSPIKKVKALSDEKNIIYLQRRFGVKRANQFLKSLPLYYWQIDYVYGKDRKFLYSKKSRQLTRIFISPVDGKIIGFNHLPKPEEYKHFRILSKDESEAIADDFFSLIDFDISGFRMSRYSSIERKHIFEWEKIIPEFKTAKLRIKLDIFGDKVGNFSYFLELHPKEIKQFESGNILASVLSTVLNVLVFALVIFVLIVSIRKRKKLEWKFGLPFALLILLTSLINFYKLIDYKGSFLITFFCVSVFSAVVYFLWTMIVSCVAKFFAKESNIDFFPIKVSSSIMLSYIFVFTGLGFTMLIYVFIQKLFNPVATLGFYSFFSEFPHFRFSFLIAPLLSLSAAVGEELFFRALMISFINRYLKRMGPAIVLSSLIWSFIHVSPIGYGDVYPGFVKGLILLPIGILFGYIFIRFGLVCAIVTHYLYDLVAIGTSYLEFSNFRYLNENVIMMLAAAILPLLIVFYLKFKKPNA